MYIKEREKEKKKALAIIATVKHCSIPVATRMNEKNTYIENPLTLLVCVCVYVVVVNKLVGRYIWLLSSFFFSDPEIKAEYNTHTHKYRQEACQDMDTHTHHI